MDTHQHSTTADRHTPHTTRPLDGMTRHRYRFENGFGASVVLHGHSYGHETGLWELGVLPARTVTYTTPITDDVLGYLSWDDVQDTLDKIAALPAVTP